MNRTELIIKLKKDQEKIWDLIVIGGGATGMGIALDGTTRGFKTLLLEQSDFGKATSSRSTKLVHGGVRYMAQGDLRLVIEALHERGLMLKNAPHLTSNQEFIIPVYTRWDAFKYTAGLKFYDLLAGPLSLGKSVFIKREEILERLPGLKSGGLIGGIVYHDGQFDDTRMVLALAKKCVDEGGLVLNYFTVTDLLKDESGRTNGVKATDMVSGEEYTFPAKAVINATGIFADSISRMDNPLIKPSIKPSQGVHIVIDKSFLGSKCALMIPKTIDERVLFAIPWQGKVIIGTTDTPVESIRLEPVALEEEVDFILGSAGKYLIKAPSRKDILCIFAGLRPLAADPGNPSSTKDVSRRHKISISVSGLISIVGGKWTTYRRMAEETIDKAISAGFLDKKECVTRHLRLYEISGINQEDPLIVYGDGMYEIKEIISNDPSMGKPVDPRLPYTLAELVWICRNEMPLTIEDLLARRTHALLLNARASLDIAEEVAGVMAKELNYDLKWQKDQVETYRALVTNYI